jgi:hypothetical protein
VPEVDVNQIFEKSDVTIAPPERDDERAVRLVKEKRGALWEDIRNITLFFVVLIALLVLAVLCANLIFFDKGATPETQKWAQTALTALVSGGAAFLFGRSLPSKK